MVAELSALNENRFMRAVSENLHDENPVETAAFRHPDLVFRTQAALRALLDQTNTQLRRREGETNKEWRRRAEHFRTIVGRERRLVETIITGLRAQRGIEFAAPNPRARAFRRLARENPVRYIQLVREEEDLDRRKAAEVKAARQKARRGQGNGSSLS